MQGSTHSEGTFAPLFKKWSLSRKILNIYKNEDFLLSKSIFENRFWTFINVHFPVYLQSLGKLIFVTEKKISVWSPKK
jgi:hypothetical protein